MDRHHVLVNGSASVIINASSMLQTQYLKKNVPGKERWWRQQRLVKLELVITEWSINIKNEKKKKC